MRNRIAVALFGVATLCWFGYLTNWKVAVALVLVFMSHNMERHNDPY